MEKMLSRVRLKNIRGQFLGQVEQNKYFRGKFKIRSLKFIVGSLKLFRF